MESTIGPSASIQYLCVSDNHIRLGLRVRDGQGHLTIRSAQWAYCSAGRPEEPHECEAIPATSFPQTPRDDHPQIRPRRGSAPRRLG